MERMRLRLLRDGMNEYSMDAELRGAMRRSSAVSRRTDGASEPPDGRVTVEFGDSEHRRHFGNAFVVICPTTLF